MFTKKTKCACSVLLLLLMLAVFAGGCESSSAPPPDEWNSLTFWKSATIQDVRNGIKAGYSVDTIFDNGHTPLIMASLFNSSPEVIEELIKAGASLGVSRGGQSPLMAAASNNRNAEIIRVLLEHGADVNARGVNGVTPVILAASSGSSVENFMLLVDAGADLTACLDDGKSVRDLAQNNKKIGPNICDFLDGYIKPEAEDN